MFEDMNKIKDKHIKSLSKRKDEGHDKLASIDRQVMFEDMDKIKDEHIKSLSKRKNEGHDKLASINRQVRFERHVCKGRLAYKFFKRTRQTCFH